MVSRISPPFPRLDATTLEAVARLAGFVGACEWNSSEEFSRDTLLRCLARRRGAGWSLAPSAWTLLLATIFVGM